MSRRALLIGINYFGTDSELDGCVSDVLNMKRHLIELGFEERDIKLMTDELSHKYTELFPSKKNILHAMKEISYSTNDGDLIVFHFSGHGGKTLAINDARENDGHDNCIYDCKFRKIIDDELKFHLIKPLHTGARLRCILDCCHSGTGMDLPWIYSRDGVYKQNYKVETKKDVIVISGCRDDQTSADVTTQNTSGGALTVALLRELRASRSFRRWYHLLNDVSNSLLRESYTQRPQLSTTAKRFMKRVIDI